MNSIRIIFPYKFEGMWVFDDPAVNLVREPFVAGIDKIIDRLVASIGEHGGEFAGFQYSAFKCRTEVIFRRL